MRPVEIVVVARLPHTPSAERSEAKIRLGIGPLSHQRAVEQFLVVGVRGIWNFASQQTHHRGLARRRVTQRGGTRAGVVFGSEVEKREKRGDR